MTDYISYGNAVPAEGQMHSRCSHSESDPIRADRIIRCNARNKLSILRVALMANSHERVYPVY